MCSNPLIVRILYLFKTTLSIIKFIIPIGLIIMTAIDLYKNLINGNDENYSNIKKIGRRMFAAILVFCIPTFITLIFELLNINTTSSNFASCYSEASLELASKLEEEENLKLKEADEASRKQALLNSQIYNAQLKAMQEENLKRNQIYKEGRA